MRASRSTPCCLKRMSVSCSCCRRGWNKDRQQPQQEPLHPLPPLPQQPPQHVDDEPMNIDDNEELEKRKKQAIRDLEALLELGALEEHILRVSFFFTFLATIGNIHRNKSDFFSKFYGSLCDMY